MKNILLIAVTALLAISTGISLEPMKVAYYTTNTNLQLVHVEIKDYSSGATLFVGDNFNLTPNGSGVVIVNIEDFPTGLNGDLSGIDASTINTNVTVDVYVGATLFSQQRLDQLIKMQSSTTVFDNSGDFNPPTTSSSLGQDDNRWEDAYVGSNTLHVGPDGGMTGGTEMTLSYDEIDNKGDISIDGTTAIELKTTGITIPNLSGVGNRNIGVDASGNVVVNNTPSVTAGNGLTLSTNTLDVGGSATIIANADDVEVNSSATANQVLLSSGTVGTAATYGALPLGDANAVGGTLPVANGGTGAATLTTGNFLQGNGTGAVTATKAVPTGDVVGTTDSQTLTNKTIDSDNNTIYNIVNADIKANAAIDATKLADGSVTSTELQYINSVTSNVQTQLDGKQANLPDQSGHNDKYLTTDGSALSWGTVSGGGAFTSSGGQTTINNLTDDFIVGDATLNHGGGTETKMFYDDSKGAFRAGSVSNDRWDDGTNVGVYSFAVGAGTIASGRASTALGEGTKAIGNASTAMGISTNAFGWYSSALGIETTSKSYAETVIGSNNTDYTLAASYSQFDWHPDDRLFVIGNGTGSGSESDAMIVYKSGDTEINGNVTIEDDLTVSNLSGAGNRNIGVDANGKLIELAGGGGGGAFTSASGQTTINNLTDDFIVGDATMDHGTGTETKMYFDDSKGAFRAGSVSNDSWDDGTNVGDYSFAVGAGTTASGNTSTAMGSSTTSSGLYSTAIGQNTEASGLGSTAIGGATIASGNYSTAMSYYTIADAFSSVAMGNMSIAIGENSTAMGNQTNATGNSATAMGSQTKASGISSTALGKSSIASGENSVAMGNQTNATGISSTAMGNITITTGNYSTAMGSNTVAIGDYSTAMGSNTRANNAYSTAMGFVTTASGNASTTMGGNTIADADNSIAMGKYNDNTVTGELLTVGNGADNANRSNAFEVYESGDVVVGNDLTISNLSGGGTQNLQVDNTGKIITGGGGGGGLPEVTVLNKSSDQIVSLPTYVNITDITTSLDANSVYKIKGMVAISFTSYEKSPYIKLDGLPTSGVIMLEAHDVSRSEPREIVNSNEFLKEFQLVNGIRYIPIDGIFQTSTSSTFNLQIRADDDPFTITDDTFFILTKIK